MKVYLHKNIERVGLEGEIISVGDGYARNYLIPRGLAIEITKKNETFYQGRIKKVEHRKEVIASQTSMLAEKIKSIKLILKKKMHDDGKLYGRIGESDIVQALSEKGITIAKNQVKFDKSIKSKGLFEVSIKLTSQLKPTLTVTVVPE